MNIAEFSIRNKLISWLITIIFLIGGAFAYSKLSRLEDPEFTIKDAVIVTQYPGASPQQVEEEVTYPLENALQQLQYVDYIRSVSTNGLSQITVTMKRQYNSNDLPQIWDELRRKVNDLAPSLPPGVQPPFVNDDFGDIFGLLFAVIGDGYSYQELNDYVDYLRRELVLVEGVGKVTVAGKQQEQVFVEIALSRMTQLGIPYQRIYEILATQNIVSNAGAIKISSENIRFHPTGEFQNVKELEDLLISSPGDQNLLYLRDVATVSRGFQEVPTHLMSLDGRQAISLGVSFASGFNVVDVGKRIDDKLKELEYARPLGIELSTLYDQPKLVEASIKAFAVNLLEAVAIVIIVLLVFMGIRSGLLIGLILFLTVIGTFTFMKLQGIDLQRISLGALIIALGMLVDNAIVITEGILIGIQRGKTKIEAASAIVKQAIWPLLGATVIAVTAFAPIGLSQDSTGEMLGSLFYVLLYSLLLSWFTAISLTPFFADMILKDKDSDTDDSDPYQGAFFKAFKGVLDTCLRHKWITAGTTVGLLVLSIYGFQQVKVVFFPAMTTPMVLVDYRKEHGTDIRQTFKEIQAVEQWILQQDNVVKVSSNTGKGGTRFMLTYSPEKIFSSYGQLMVEFEDYKQIDPFIASISQHLDDQYSDVNYDFKKFELGPSKDGKIEARFSGPDPDVLRRLSIQAKDILHQQPNVVGIRDDWKKRTKVVRPQFSEAQARRAGISKQDLDDVLQMSYSGKSIGLYRDGTTLLPIIARPPEDERSNIDTIHSLQIWSPVYERYISIEQVVREFTVEWEDAVINRRDRKRTITIIANANLLGEETSNDLYKKVKPAIEAIELPKGYSLVWGGEAESSADANGALMGAIPMGVIVMFIITVLLFNTIKQPLVIWSLAPMAIIGVAFGLLITNSAFTFMALLGFISLVGMLLKNGIVLVDQINLELHEGKHLYHAIFDSAVSRVRPVSMAAATTILGMIPLLFDAFFSSMAVTIMFGLGFATVLTLIVVPAIYAIVYKVEYIPLEK
ncbi:MAG: MFS transporter [endosymbiont of Galathealinum brachiosum]|uniref:MFS transporter n=1 Tax=endosymbiont of Galathealinum brachiosum TaxID=2200906 RepID=A0A370DJ85_9GAMM|nr:MAG: MFS transporter [endosymbiont of Galathealinum brachiosum]